MPDRGVSRLEDGEGGFLRIDVRPDPLQVLLWSGGSQCFVRDEITDWAETRVGWW